MEGKKTEIPLSFDDFVNPEAPSGIEGETSLDKKFSQEREEWTEKIKTISLTLRNVLEISDLMTYIYTERQRAVEYYHYLATIYGRVNRVWRKAYSEKYDFHTYKSQKRFPNERAKEIHIFAELNDLVKKRETIENHMKFIDRSIGTIDNIIFGIKYRLEIEQISRGK